jgi:hypothetical protein
LFEIQFHIIIWTTAVNGLWRYCPRDTAIFTGSRQTQKLKAKN